MSHLSLLKLLKEQQKPLAELQQQQRQQQQQQQRGRQQLLGFRDLVEESFPGDGESEKVERAKYNYGIVVHSDFPGEAKQKEILELCQIACEKFAAPEKTPIERDNFRAAEMIKEALDKKMGGPFNVVVGESFSIEMDFVKSTLFYMYFGGYLAILVWKCS